MARETINLLQQIGVETAGVAQVETATVAGTPADGTAAVTVTASGMTGSPVAVTTPILSTDSLANVATKIANALANDVSVSSFFAVRASSTTIILTALTPAANDATMNLSIAAAAGLTAAASSANTTAGVAASSGVAATKRFSGLEINITDAIETKQFRSWGAKANTISAIHKLWAKGSYKGPLSYVEICYILASLAPKTVTADSPVAGVTEWNFLPNPTGSDSVNSFTLEDGDDEAVERYSSLQFLSFEGTWGLDDITCSGEVISKPHTNIGGLTAGTSLLAQRPVLRSHVDLFIDTAYGSIGTTKFPDTFDGKFKIGNKFDPKWVLNTSETSWKELVEKIPEMSMTTVIEANAQGRALVYDITTNNTGRYIRLRSQGGIVTGSTPYLLQFDMYGQAQDIRPQKDLNGMVYAYEIDWTAINDDTMGRAWRAKVYNALTAL